MTLARIRLPAAPDAALHLNLLCFAVATSLCFSLCLSLSLSLPLPFSLPLCISFSLAFIFFNAATGANANAVQPTVEGEITT